MKATVLAVAMVLAAGGCASSTHPAMPDGGDAGTALGPLLAACDHYYAAQFNRCGGPILPADENARQRGRFEQVCAAEVALAGSTVTAAALEACASALDISPCEFPEGLPQACIFYGSLPGGIPCAFGNQCQSGYCEGTSVAYAPFVCGTCFSTTCPTGQGCSPTSDGFAGRCTCVPITQGDAGAPCDDQVALCQLGLYCAEQTSTCQPLAAAGAPCGDELDNPDGCAAPYECGPEFTCVSGADGGPCQSDAECAPGLGCLTLGPCAPINWVAAGEPCGNTDRCLVGSCFCGDVGTPGPLPDGGFPVGLCPTLIPDGQPCFFNGATTCDAFAECLEGTCVLLESASCQ